MKLQGLTFLSAGVLLGIASNSCLAQQHANHAMYSSPNLSAQDKAYLDEAAQTNLGEIKILPLVERKAQWPASRQLATHYAMQHNIAENKLQRLARTLHYNLPTDVNLKQKASALYLSLQPRSSFDKTYRSDMIKGHMDAIENTRQELSQGSNPLVKQYAAKMLPDLQMHLAQAKSLPSGSTMRQASM